MRTILRTVVAGLVAIGASSVAPRSASACGGFFCNRTQPVNQAAEGIIFSENGDGTVTAVIQIKYEGPSTNFSWLLPISSVPSKPSDVGVASNLALQRLQSATNPTYTLNTRIEGTCRQDFNGSVGAGGSASAAGPGISVGGGDQGGVTVAASGSVGPYDWQVITLDKSLAKPADAAVEWLTKNGYDVPSSAPDLLGPYLEQGLNLLALRLTKGADSGSIRPIVVTYQGTQASIPIKLTAVAANDNMGVLTWVLGESRVVPQNYLSLELNEARINWFNASSNYNSVVTAAAQDAGGRGFVTEFAGATTTLKAQIWTSFDDANWQSFNSNLYQSFSEFFQQAYAQYGQYDGFWDATQAAVTLPAKVSFDDFKVCPNCYADQITFSPSTYLSALKTQVIEPIQLVQNLVDAHPEMTRLYTTMSAADMTLDPLFIGNPELPDVSNVHTADRIIECSPNVSQFEAPWRIELPQGGVIRGTGSNAGTWPDFSDQAPNLRLVRMGASGTGKVVEDNTQVIASSLATYNASVENGTAAAGGSAAVGPGSTPGGSSSSLASGGGGCSIDHTRHPLAALLGLSTFGLILARRRRRRAH